VLIVRDAGVRSALIARLSLQGESLVTLDADPEDSYVFHVAPAPRVLIADRALLGDRLEAILATDLWRGVIALADDGEQPVPGDPLSIVRQGEALAGVAETLERWRARPLP